MMERDKTPGLGGCSWQDHCLSVTGWGELARSQPRGGRRLVAVAVWAGSGFQCAAVLEEGLAAEPGHS